ncbi:MAG: TonB-dependent receptor [Gammaproteobacteria bacterium]|nr:TonB-dependent receptor [Gammaproteobacteria bacterium]
MFIRFGGRGSQWTVAALAVLAVAGMANAQERDGGQGLEEIIVTAQKREESLHDTPISIVAFSANQLADRGISSLEGLQADVPSLNLSPHPQSTTTVRAFIRGIGIVNDQISYDPSVAIYLDGVYVARFQGLASEVAEIDRIEVLRGPQGSLYGRNSTGGAINFITKAPQLGDFGFRQDLSVGNYNLLRARTRVNIPVGDSLAAELSFLRVSKNGFVRNIGTGVSRYGDEDRYAYRAALLWRPREHLDFRYTYDRSELDDTPGFIARVPMYPVEGERPDHGPASESNLQANHGVGQGHNLTATLELSEALTLRSITAYRDLDSWTERRYHPGVLAPPPLNWSVVDIFQRQFSEEVQAIGSALDARLQYVAGLYWFDESATSDEVNRRPLVPDRTDRHLTATNRAFAVYAQGTYTPLALEKRLHLTAGARWSRDEREAGKYSVTTPGSGVPRPPDVGQASRTFSDFSPSAVAAFDVTGDLNVYAKIATGYKTGGFNLFASSIARFAQGFGPESVTSYELGLKSNWLDRRLRVNAALFTADYKDIQLSVSSDPSNISITDVLNAGRASVDGLELDVMARPIPALNLSLAYAWLRGGYDRVVDSTGRDITSLYGFVEVPKHKLSTTLEYTFPQTRFGVPSAMLTYSYQAKRIASTSCKACIIGGYGLLDARLTLADLPAGRGKLRFSLWGRNLTNEDYYTMYLMVLVPSAVFGDPRSYGADLSYVF